MNEGMNRETELCIHGDDETLKASVVSHISKT